MDVIGPATRTTLRSGALVAVTIAISEAFYFINLGAWAATGQLAAPNPWWLTASIAGLLAMQGLALIWRNRYPFAAFWFIYAVFIAMTLLQGSRELAAGPTLWVGVFVLTSRPITRGMVATLVAAVMGDMAIQLAQIDELGSASAVVTASAIIVRTIAAYLICVLLGVWVGWQRRSAELANERSELLRAQSESRVREALARERNAMARELHDIAAHHLSAITIQSKAALLVHPSEPDLVAELLADIRRQSLETLTSLRQIVGILRENDDAELAPERTIADVAELVESTRNVGVRVDLRTSGDLDVVPAAAALAGYRIVQESLSNARRHASGASVAVDVHVSCDQVSLSVTNQAPPQRSPDDELSPGNGFGITGMRERVQLLGGTFTYGVTPEGGWRTCAIIPMQQGEQPA